MSEISGCACATHLLLYRVKCHCPQMNTSSVSEVSLSWDAPGCKTDTASTAGTQGAGGRFSFTPHFSSAWTSAPGKDPEGFTVTALLGEGWTNAPSQVQTQLLEYLNFGWEKSWAQDSGNQTRWVQGKHSDLLSCIIFVLIRNSTSPFINRLF